jgi:hypothetical protein
MVCSLSGFLTRNLYGFFVLPMRSTCPARYTKLPLHCKMEMLQNIHFERSVLTCMMTLWSGDLESCASSDRCLHHAAPMETAAGSRELTRQAGHATRGTVAQCKLQQLSHAARSDGNTEACVWSRKEERIDEIKGTNSTKIR